jgi:hypothetical protein
MRPYLKNKLKQKGQEVGLRFTHLSSKYKALSSNLSTTKKKLTVRPRWSPISLPEKGLHRSLPSLSAGPALLAGVLSV